MDYNFNDIEKKWQKQWAHDKTYHVGEDADKEKFYVLPYRPDSTRPSPPKPTSATTASSWTR